MPKNVPDLDATLDFEEESEALTTKVKLFGREWDLNTDVNTWNATALMGQGDAAAMYQYLHGLVAEDQWQEFSTALGKVPKLDAVKLWKIVNVMTEAVVERPTVPPSASRPGATKRTSSPKSGGGTASRRATTSRA